MMTSSGSGPYRVGGLGSFSSSSNLSPLAPPFRVDKSLQKQNSTNTPVNYPDVHMYGPYVDPNGQLWNPSSCTSEPKFEATESMGFSNNCSSSPANYGYSVSQPSTTAASAYHVASGSAAAYDPFSYDPFPNRMSTAAEEGLKPYYSPYVPPPPQKDGYLSLGVSNGLGYDLLPNCSSANLSSSESSASDHPQVMSGDGDHKLNWGSFWSGGNKQGTWPEYAQGFGSKDSSLSDLVSSKSPFLFDESNKSQPSTDVHAHPFVDGSSNMNLSDGGTRSNLKQDGCFDIFGGVYHLGSLGIGQQDSKSLLGCSRPSASVPALVPQESSHFQGPVVESVTNLCSSQKPIGSSPGDHFSNSGFYVFGCTSTSSTFPITKNKSLYGESSSSAEGYDYSCQIEPRVPIGSKRQSSVIIRRPLASVVPPSSQIGQSLNSRIGSKDGSEQVSPKMPNQFSSDRLDLAVNVAQAAFSADKISGGSDVHNPAEDSPCWRGASSNRFSPFVVSEGTGPDVFGMKLDEPKSLSTQDPQMKSFLVDTSDGQDLFSEKVKGNNLSESPLVPVCISKDGEERCSAIRQPLRFDLNSADGLQFADDSYVSTKKCCILNNTDSGITLAGIQISNGGETPSPQTSEKADSEGSDNCPPVVANESLDGPSSSQNNHATSTLGDNGTLKHCLPSSKISDSNIDINMLLKTMTNLSEIFRCYCFSKRASIPQQHSFAIKQIIANLNASMLMMAGETSSTMELPVAQMVNDAADEAVAAAVKLGGTAEGLLDAASCKDDPNTIGDVNVLEALKKILQENFHEEEMNQQKLLYKSLWLDAEASLCTMTAKARFLRVKAEMERTHDVTEDREISSCSNASGDVHGTVDLTTHCKDSSVKRDCQKYCEAIQNNHAEGPEVKEGHIPNAQAVTEDSVDIECPETTNVDSSFPITNASRQGYGGSDSDASGSASHANDVEGSVMARYQILKSRIESSVALQENKESSVGHEDPSSLYISGFDTHGAGTTSDVMGTNNPVLDRYQILKSQIESSVARQENTESSVGHKDPSSLYVSGFDSHGAGTTTDAMGADNPVLARYQILKSRIASSVARQENKESSLMGADNPVLARYQILRPRVIHDSLSNECNSPPGEYNYLPDRDCSSHTYQILKCGPDNSESLNEGKDFENSQLLSNSVGVPDEDGEALVMGRFHIIQNRVNHSETVDKDQPLLSPEKVVEGVTDQLGFSEQPSSVLSSAFWPYPHFTENEDREASVIDRFRIIQSRVNHSSKTVDKDQILLSPEKEVEGGTDQLAFSEQQISVLRSAFGPYPDFTEDEDGDQLGGRLLKDGDLTRHCKTNRLNSEIFESWYDNDCSSSDWEHVSKEDLRRPI